MRKVIVCGPYNAGKTTFVRNVSPKDFTGTEEKEFDVESLMERGTTTTVGVEINLYKDKSGELLFIGLPGQERFDFIWEIVGEKFDAILFLFPAHKNVDELKLYINFYSKLNSFKNAFKAILVTHPENANEHQLEKFKEFGFPIILIDPRDESQVKNVVRYISKFVNGAGKR